MSMKTDITIGKLYYGWTEEQTEINKWYDPWAQIWRPIPQNGKGVPTPAFSGNETFAVKLIEHLDSALHISTEVVRNVHVWFVTMDIHKTNIFAFGEDVSFSIAVASCAINLNQQKEFSIENIQQLNTLVSVSESPFQN